MRKRTFIYSALAGAAAAALVLIPSAGSATGDPLILGSSTNSATANTILNTTAVWGLYVLSEAPSTVPLQGNAFSHTGAGVGIRGNTNSGDFGTAGVEGLLGSTAPSSSDLDVGKPAGVRGSSYSTTAYGPGVYGIHFEGTGSAPGVLGETSSTDAYAVGTQGRVRANNAGSNAAGVYGSINSSADYSGGVRGENFNSVCCGFGVVGFHAGQGIGIGGYAPNGFGVFGWSPNNWAGYFDGAVEVVHDLHVNGTLFKGAGAFRIDNPLDPARSYLQHSFVESPQMMNVYNGNVTTDAKGFATVQLPRWFQALNKDFRYQLTVVGKAHWDAKAAVWQEVKNNRFTIRTDQANTKVSWQVTGIRHDPYANKHRIQVVVPKTGAEADRYAHPELYRQPASKGIDAAVGPPRALPKLHPPALKAAARALLKQR